MRVVIAGGHGKIALITARLLSARGDSVAGLIRNPDHADDLRVACAEPVVVDLENTTNGVVSTHLRGADDVFVAYLRAKGAADDVIRARTSLLTTIVRPGLLTDDEATGKVTVAEHTGRGSIPRADVAAVLVAVLVAPDTAGRTFEVISGDAAIADAVAALT